MTWSRTRVLALLLFLSVSLNLFIAGLMVGRLDRWEGHGGHGWRHGPSMSRMIEKTFGDTLSPELSNRLSTHFETMRETHKQVRESRSLIRDALIREPFDKQIYLGALEDMNALHDQMRAQTHGFMLDIIDDLTPEQRRRLIESMDRHRKGRWSGPRGKDD